MTQAAMGGIVE
jgi:hypothetical protein